MKQRLKKGLIILLSLLIVFTMYPISFNTEADTGTKSGTGTKSAITERKNKGLPLDSPYLTYKQKERLNKEIHWIDFNDKTHTKVFNEKGKKISNTSNLILKKGYRFEFSPYAENGNFDDYVITFKVSALQPYTASEVYRDRILDDPKNADLKAQYNNSSTKDEALATLKSKYFYDPNAKNSKYTVSGMNTSEYVMLTTFGESNGEQWANLARCGIFTDSSAMAHFKSKNQQSNVGVTFEVSAVSHGESTQPNIIFADTEESGDNEFVGFYTDGSPWELLANVNNVGSSAGKVSDDTVYPNGSGSALRNNPPVPYKASQMNKGDGYIMCDDTAEYFINKDGVNGGLGTSFFGPVTNKISKKYGTYILMTRAPKKVSAYICAGGKQTFAMGVVELDEGDAPEGKVNSDIDYGTASHTIANGNQPYLGKVKADYEVHNKARDLAAEDWLTDDIIDKKDEGEAQLMGDNNDGKYPALISSKGSYTINIKANNNSNTEGSFVRGFLDYDNSTSFDYSFTYDGDNYKNNEKSKNECTDIINLNGNSLSDVSLTLNNIKQLANTVDHIGMRVRIAREKEDVLLPIGAAYSGEVEDFLIPVVHSPSGFLAETVGFQGQSQTSPKIVFKAHGKLATDSTVANEMSDKSIRIVDPDNPNNTLAEYTDSDGNKYTVVDAAGNKVDNVNGAGVKIKFEPKSSFTGKAKGVAVRAWDKNNNSTAWHNTLDETKNKNDIVKIDGKKTMDAVYKPVVTAVTPVGVGSASSDVQGNKQTGRIDFASGAKEVNLADIHYNDGVNGDKKLKDLAKADLDIAASRIEDNYGNVKFINAYDDSDTVIGKYIITKEITENNTGQTALAGKDLKIDFVPNKNFSGKVKPLKFKIKDQNGTESNEVEYAPSITAVKPSGVTRVSQGAKDQTRKVTIVATAGHADVPIDDNKKFVLVDPTDSSEPNVKKVKLGTKYAGKYVLNTSTGEVTFDPTNSALGADDAGKLPSVTIKSYDINGTKAESTYTHTILATKVIVDDVNTTAKQGDEQNVADAKLPKFVKKAPPHNDYTFSGTEKLVVSSSSSAATITNTGNVHTVKDNEGTYTVTIVNNKVTAIKFQPKKSFTGVANGIKITVKDGASEIVSSIYLPTVMPVTPIGKTVKTVGVQGKTQEEDLFPSGEEDKYFEAGQYKNEKVNFDKSTLKFDNNKTSKKTTQGTYQIVKEDGKYKVQFTPKDDYTGSPNPEEITIEDQNGTKATAKYYPKVIPLKPLGVTKRSEDVQGVDQFIPAEDVFEDVTIIVGGSDVTTDVKDGVEEDDKLKLKGADSNGKVKIAGEGTYSIVEKDGKKQIKFSPEDSFVGKPTPVEVELKYAGSKIIGIYAPKVKTVLVSGDETKTTGNKNEKQTVTPKFTYDNGKDNGKKATGEVRLLDKDGKRVVKVPAYDKDNADKLAGSYGIDADGKVTFTPAEDYVGIPKPVTVEIIDTKYGVKGTATYQPTVKNSNTKHSKGSSSSSSGGGGGGSSSGGGFAGYVPSVSTEDSTAGSASSYVVGIKYISADSKPLPDEIKNMPTKEYKGLKNGDVVTVVKPEQTVVEVADGKWIFRGFDKTNITVKGKNENFFGKWLFLPEGTPTYKVETEFVSSDPNRELPQEIKDLASEMVLNLIAGDKVDAVYPEVLEIKVAGGKWVFKAFDKDSHTIIDKDGKITGVWEFIPDEIAPEANVTKQADLKKLPDTGDGLSPIHYLMIGLTLSLLMFLVGFRFRIYEKKKSRRH